MVIEINAPDIAKEYKELRQTVRAFLRATQDVPYRAVDCDQRKVDSLWNRLAKASGYRE